MKRMLVNATQPEELRLALVDGQRIYDLDIEHPGRRSRKANLYKGKITRVEPSLEACFVDYGSQRHGFLPLKEIARQYFKEGVDLRDKPSIKDLVAEGTEVLVQVEKEERGNKGAALTTFVSLAGRFLVLMPNNPRAGGVSRRIDGSDRNELRDAMKDLQAPNGMGVIARTAGVGRTAEELQWDLDYLIQLWHAIETASADKKAPFLVYEESRLIVRALRDYYNPDVGEILVDDPQVYNQAKEFMEQVMPNNLPKLKFYQDETPLFSRFQIEGQIQSAFQREVQLPSGGSIVIDVTEALTAIDINSARATKGADIEETATNTNLEAAEEIARQLRIRDTGGLVVVDFIDMHSNRNQRAVEERLRDSVRMDRARIQIGKISRFGLLELSRQRLRPSLGESAHVICPRCSGQGNIRSVESLSLSVLRLMEEESMKENTGQVICQLPVPAATFLLNEKRQMLAEVEARCGVGLLIVPNEQLETPHFIIDRKREGEVLEGPKARSYRLEKTEVADAETPIGGPAKTNPAEIEKAAVQSIKPVAPKPEGKKPVAGVGLLASLVTMLKNLLGFGEDKKKKAKGRKNNNRGRNQNNRRGKGQQSRGQRGNQNNPRNQRGNQNRQNRNDKRNDDRRKKPETDKKENVQAKEKDDKKNNGRNDNNRNKGRNNKSEQKEQPQGERKQRNRNQQRNNDKPRSNENNTDAKQAAKAVETKSAEDKEAAKSTSTADKATANIAPKAEDGEDGSSNTQQRARRSRRGGRRRRRPADGQEAANKQADNKSNDANGNVVEAQAAETVVNGNVAEPQEELVIEVPVVEAVEVTPVTVVEGESEPASNDENVASEAVNDEAPTSKQEEPVVAAIETATEAATAVAGTEVATAEADADEKAEPESVAAESDSKQEETAAQPKEAPRQPFFE